MPTAKELTDLLSSSYFDKVLSDNHGEFSMITTGGRTIRVRKRTDMILGGVGKERGYEIEVGSSDGSPPSFYTAKTLGINKGQIVEHEAKLFGSSYVSGGRKIGGKVIGRDQDIDDLARLFSKINLEKAKADSQNLTRARARARARELLPTTAHYEQDFTQALTTTKRFLTSLVDNAIREQTRRKRTASGRLGELTGVEKHRFGGSDVQMMVQGFKAAVLNEEDIRNFLTDIIRESQGDVLEYIKKIAANKGDFGKNALGKFKNTKLGKALFEGASGFKPVFGSLVRSGSTADINKDLRAFANLISDINQVYKNETTVELDSIDVGANSEALNDPKISIEDVGNREKITAEVAKSLLFEREKTLPDSAPAHSGAPHSDEESKSSAERPVDEATEAKSLLNADGTLDASAIKSAADVALASVTAHISSQKYLKEKLDELVRNVAELERELQARVNSGAMTWKEIQDFNYYKSQIAEIANANPITITKASEAFIYAEGIIKSVRDAEDMVVAKQEGLNAVLEIYNTDSTISAYDFMLRATDLVQDFKQKVPAKPRQDAGSDAISNYNRLYSKANAAIEMYNAICDAYSRYELSDNSVEADNSFGGVYQILESGNRGFVEKYIQSQTLTPQLSKLKNPIAADLKESAKGVMDGVMGACAIQISEKVTLDVGEGEDASDDQRQKHQQLQDKLKDQAAEIILGSVLDFCPELKKDSAALVGSARVYGDFIASKVTRSDLSASGALGGDLSKSSDFSEESAASLASLEGPTREKFKASAIENNEYNSFFRREKIGDNDFSVAVEGRDTVEKRINYLYAFLSKTINNQNTIAEMAHDITSVIIDGFTDVEQLKDLAANIFQALNQNIADKKTKTHIAAQIMSAITEKNPDLDIDARLEIAEELNWRVDIIRPTRKDKVALELTEMLSAALQGLAPGSEEYFAVVYEIFKSKDLSEDPIAITTSYKALIKDVIRISESDIENRKLQAIARIGGNFYNQAIMEAGGKHDAKYFASIAAANVILALKEGNLLGSIEKFGELFSAVESSLKDEELKNMYVATLLSAIETAASYDEISKSELENFARGLRNQIGKTRVSNVDAYCKELLEETRDLDILDKTAEIFESLSKTEVSRDFTRARVSSFDRRKRAAVANLVAQFSFDSTNFVDIIGGNIEAINNTSADVLYLFFSKLDGDKKSLFLDFVVKNIENINPKIIFENKTFAKELVKHVLKSDEASLDFFYATTQLNPDDFKAIFDDEGIKELFENKTKEFIELFKVVLRSDTHEANARRGAPSHAAAGAPDSPAPNDDYARAAVLAQYSSQLLHPAIAMLFPRRQDLSSSSSSFSLGDVLSAEEKQNILNTKGIAKDIVSVIFSVDYAAFDGDVVALADDQIGNNSFASTIKDFLFNLDLEAIDEEAKKYILDSFKTGGGGLIVSSGVFTAEMFVKLIEGLEDSDLKNNEGFKNFMATVNARLRAEVLRGLTGLKILKLSAEESDVAEIIFDKSKYPTYIGLNPSYESMIIGSIFPDGLLQDQNNEVRKTIFKSPYLLNKVTEYLLVADAEAGNFKRTANFFLHAPADVRKKFSSIIAENKLKILGEERAVDAIIAGSADLADSALVGLLAGSDNAEADLAKLHELRDIINNLQQKLLSLDATRFTTSIGVCVSMLQGIRGRITAATPVPAPASPPAPPPVPHVTPAPVALTAKDITSKIIDDAILEGDPNFTKLKSILKGVRMSDIDSAVRVKFFQDHEGNILKIFNNDLVWILQSLVGIDNDVRSQIILKIFRNKPLNKEDKINLLKSSRADTIMVLAASNQEFGNLFFNGLLGPKDVINAIFDGKDSNRLFSFEKNSLRHFIINSSSDVLRNYVINILIGSVDDKPKLIQFLSNLHKDTIGGLAKIDLGQKLEILRRVSVDDLLRAPGLDGKAFSGGDALNNARVTQFFSNFLQNIDVNLIPGDEFAEVKDKLTQISGHTIFSAGGAVKGLVDGIVAEIDSRLAAMAPPPASPRVVTPVPAVLSSDDCNVRLRVASNKTPPETITEFQKLIREANAQRKDLYELFSEILVDLKVKILKDVDVNELIAEFDSPKPDFTANGAVNTSKILSALLVGVEMADRSATAKEAGATAGPRPSRRNIKEIGEEKLLAILTNPELVKASGHVVEGQDVRKNIYDMVLKVLGRKFGLDENDVIVGSFVADGISKYKKDGNELKLLEKLSAAIAYKKRDGGEISVDAKAVACACILKEHVLNSTNPEEEAKKIPRIIGAIKSALLTASDFLDKAQNLSMRMLRGTSTARSSDEDEKKGSKFAPPSPSVAFVGRQAKPLGTVTKILTTYKQPATTR